PRSYAAENGCGARLDKVLSFALGTRHAPAGLEDVRLLTCRTAQPCDPARYVDRRFVAVAAGGDLHIAVKASRSTVAFSERTGWRRRGLDRRAARRNTPCAPGPARGYHGCRERQHERRHGGRFERDRL